MKRPTNAHLSSKALILALVAVSPLSVRDADAVEIPATSVIADSFHLVGTRQAGASLKGTVTESGDLNWKTSGAPLFRQDGVLTIGTSGSASAWVPLPNEVVQSPFKVQVDCQVATTDWVALSLGGELGDFFKTAKITLILRPSGNYALFAGSGPQLWDTPLLQGKATNFDATGWNNLELEFDPTKSLLSATVNGTSLVRDHALEEAFATDQVQCAGVYFNETTGARPPMQPEIPAVDNFAVTPLQAAGTAAPKTGPQKAPTAKTAQTLIPIAMTGAKVENAPILEPLNRTQFFLRPNEPGVLKWKVKGDLAQLTCEVTDYRSHPVLSQTVEVKEREAQLPLRLPSGFYDLKFQPGGQRYGVVVSVPQQGAPDKFFAMDAALSWLETRPQVRSDLVALLKRSGIGLVRERLSWEPLNPQAEQWDWETNRQFDTLRQEYQRQDIKVLELFHGAPGWTKTEPTSTYPQRLGETKKSWETIAKHWQGIWDAVEVWNEPDIGGGGEWPADQYLPTVKTINYALRESQVPAQVGGGVFGYFNPAFIQSSVKNGLLDQVDFVSFHTYAKAPAMEQVISDYRRALTVKGQAPVPLWLTESGQPWKSGQARPEANEDATTALDITMKAIEARACGIARYFAFVYPYYVEGERNFGMMGQEVTPLRSMAAYVQAVAALSNANYVGDLKLPGASVQRARVFAKGDEATVVLYAENAGANSSVAWSGPLTRVQGIDGRALKRLANGSIPLSDGLVYVHASLKTLKGLMRQTTATQLTATAKSARLARPAASAIVLQPMLPPSAAVTKRGYKVAVAALTAFPLRVQVNNLSDTPRQLQLHCAVNGAGILPERRIEMAPGASTEVAWDVDLAQALQKSSAEAVALDVMAQEQAEATVSSLSLEMFSERDLPTYLRLYPSSTKVDLSDLTRWKANISPVGQMNMRIDGKNWQLQSSFKPGDHWVYPEFQLPASTALSGSSGFLMRARAKAPSTVRIMVKERSGATYFTPFSIIPADGEWHSLVIQWPDLAALPSAPPDANGQLDLNQVTSISLGMNSNADENTLEVSDFYVAQKSRKP